MADVLLNKIINKEIDVDLLIKWVLDINKDIGNLDAINSCTCSRIDFITYFINFIHEDILSSFKANEANILKVNTPKRIEKTSESNSHSFRRVNLFENENNPENTSTSQSSTPKVIRIQSERNQSYCSPVSPIYNNQNNFSTPSIRKSAEKASPLRLGDFIVTKKSSNKKKSQRAEKSAETCKRINPTRLCQRKLSVNFSKSENSFNFQNSFVEEESVENINEQRNFLAEERVKILSRKSSGEDIVNGLKAIYLQKSESQIEPDIDLVSFKEQINCVVKIYVNFIYNKLFLNVTSEIYFLISLLLDKKLRIGKQNGNDSSSSFGDGFDLLNSAENFNKSVYNTEIFETVHNVTFFVVECLSNLLNFIKYYDKSTLKLLSCNKTITIFSPSLAEKLSNLSETKSERIIDICDNNLETNVCFNLDTDNRENFPNDLSFHAFRKQRDLFYEIIRIWENNHLVSGWNFTVSLTGKIKSLFNLHNSPANFMHFARLFKAQLLSSCGKFQKEEGLSESQLPLLSFANVDADKLNKLKSRLVTKESSNGINSLPSFHGHQEFYKEFIITATHHTFNKHLSDVLIADILDLNDTKFNCTELQESASDVDSETRQAYMKCIKSLRMLAKFLGFVESLPYKSELTNYSQNLLQSQIALRQNIQPALNLKKILTTSIREQTLIISVPWIIKYLSMLDYVTLRLPYYTSVLTILFYLYRNYSVRLSSKYDNFNDHLIIISLGWLFELPHFPDSEYFNFYINSTDKEISAKLQNANNVNKERNDEMRLVGLDEIRIVDQNILYVCCPYLEEIKKLLSSNVLNKNVTVKHITPVTAHQSSNEITQKRLESQLEESFFNSQPVSVRKTVDFVSERIASSCVKHICYSIVPTYKKTAFEKLKDTLKIWKQEMESLSPTNRRNFKDSLKSKVIKLAEDNCKELQDLCDNEIEKITKQKVPESMNSLLALDMLPQSKNVCVTIANKLCRNRIYQWKNSHVTINIFLKDFDFELQRMISEHGSAKVKPAFLLPPGGSAGEHDESTLSAAHLLEKIKESTINIIEKKVYVTQDFVTDLLDDTLNTISRRTDVNQNVISCICSLLLDMSIIILSNNSFVMSESIVLSKFETIWKYYYSQPDDLFKNLMSERNIMILAQSHDVDNAWKVLAKVIVFLINQGLLSCDSFETQCIGLFRKEWDPITLRCFTNFLNAFVKFYTETGGVYGKFVYLLDFLSDYCNDL